MIQGQIVNITSTYTCHFHYKGKPLLYTNVSHHALCRQEVPLSVLALVVRWKPQTFALQVI